MTPSTTSSTSRASAGGVKMTGVAPARRSASTYVAGTPNAREGHPRTRPSTSGCATMPTRGRRPSLRVEDVLHLRVEVHRVHPHLAPHAALLVPAEGRLGVHAVARVHADHAGAHALRYADRASDVPRPHRSRQAVLDVVREPYRLVLGVERDHARDGSEDLLLGDAPCVVDVRED